MKLQTRRSPQIYEISRRKLIGVYFAPHRRHILPNRSTFRHFDVEKCAPDDTDTDNSESNFEWDYYDIYTDGYDVPVLNSDNDDDDLLFEDWNFENSSNPEDLPCPIDLNCGENDGRTTDLTYEHEYLHEETKLYDTEHEPENDVVNENTSIPAGYMSDYENNGLIGTDVEYFTDGEYPADIDGDT